MNAPVDVSFFARAAKPITSYRKYWASRFGTAPFLPMSRAEMDALGWDSCDIIIVTGDAYVDHPSFGMAVIGRVLEAQGFRVGIIAQPDWHSAEPFKALGKPNLFFGVTAGNMDSMINRYTADRKIRSDDAYTPGDVGGKRPDRAAIVYAQRCREAFKRRADRHRRHRRLPAPHRALRLLVGQGAPLDRCSTPSADLLLYGNAERAHRRDRAPPGRAASRSQHITDVRGTAFMRAHARGLVARSTRLAVDTARAASTSTSTRTRRTSASQARWRKEDRPPAPPRRRRSAAEPAVKPILHHDAAKRARRRPKVPPRDQHRGAPALLRAGQERPGAVRPRHRVLHLETNPGNARALVQAHGDRDVWLNPPPIPLTTAEMDDVFDLPYARARTRYADELRQTARPRSRPGK